MNMTPKQEIEMYGCSEEMLRALFEGRTPWGEPLLSIHDEHIDPALQVVSLLSDVQELMAIVSSNIELALVGNELEREKDRLELARQLVNRAKFGVYEYLRRPRTKTETGR